MEEEHRRIILRNLCANMINSENQLIKMNFTIEEIVKEKQRLREVT